MEKELSDYLYYETPLGKLYCGDCLSILPLIKDKVDLVLTDPPYGIDFLSPRTDNHKKLEGDEYGDFSINFEKWIKLFSNVMSDTACCCCCCGGGKKPVSAIATMIGIKYLNLIQTLIWKKFIGLGWHYRPAYEVILIFSKSIDKYNFYDKSKSLSNVIENINQDIPQKGEHPTQKPVELMLRLLKIHSIENHIVIDPFCGGGTTAVACEKLNRKWIGIEISEAYCKIAKHRIKAEADQMKMELK